MQGLTAQIRDFFDPDKSYNRRAQVKLGLRYSCWCGSMHHRPNRHSADSVREIINRGLQGLALEVSCVSFRGIHYACRGIAIADVFGITDGLWRAYDKVVEGFYQNDKEKLLTFSRVSGYHKKLGWVVSMFHNRHAITVCNENGDLDIVYGREGDTQNLRIGAYKVKENEVITLCDAGAAWGMIFKYNEYTGEMEGEEMHMERLEGFPKLDVGDVVKRIIEQGRRELQEVIDIEYIEGRLRTWKSEH